MMRETRSNTSPDIPPQAAGTPIIPDHQLPPPQTNVVRKRSAIPLSPLLLGEHSNEWSPPRYVEPPTPEEPVPDIGSGQPAGPPKKWNELVLDQRRLQWRTDYREALADDLEGNLTRQTVRRGWGTPEQIAKNDRRRLGSLGIGEIDDLPVDEVLDSNDD